MDYLELEKLYKFHINNSVQITKHGVEIPSMATVEKLRDEYKITGEIKKYIQVLEDKKHVSFVFNISPGLTLFQTLCGPNDEYSVDGYSAIEEF